MQDITSLSRTLIEDHKTDLKACLLQVMVLTMLTNKLCHLEKMTPTLYINISMLQPCTWLRNAYPTITKFITLLLMKAQWNLYDVPPRSDDTHAQCHFLEADCQSEFNSQCLSLRICIVLGCVMWLYRLPALQAKIC